MPPTSKLLLIGPPVAAAIGLRGTEPMELNVSFLRAPDTPETVALPAPRRVGAVNYESSWRWRTDLLLKHDHLEWTRRFVVMSSEQAAAAGQPAFSDPASLSGLGRHQPHLVYELRQVVKDMLPAECPSLRSSLWAGMLAAVEEQSQMQAQVPASVPSPPLEQWPLNQLLTLVQEQGERESY